MSFSAKHRVGYRFSFCNDSNCLTLSFSMLFSLAFSHFRSFLTVYGCRCKGQWVGGCCGGGAKGMRVNTWGRRQWKRLHAVGATVGAMRGKSVGLFRLLSFLFSCSFSVFYCALLPFSFLFSRSFFFAIALYIFCDCALYFLRLRRE